MKNETTTQQDISRLRSYLRSRYGEYRIVAHYPGYTGAIATYPSTEHRAANGGRMWLFAGYVEDLLKEIETETVTE